MTNFEKRWAWFFTLLGWQWEYWPKTYLFRGARPDFRVCIPCGHSECDGSHLLDVFLRRGVISKEQFGVTVYDLAAVRRGADSPYHSPHPALFGDNPSATVWEMSHGNGGGEFCIPYWEHDWEKVWAAARIYSRSVLPVPDGRLR